MDIGPFTLDAMMALKGKRVELRHTVNGLPVGTKGVITSWTFQAGYAQAEVEWIGRGAGRVPKVDLFTRSQLEHFLEEA